MGSEKSENNFVLLSRPVFMNLHKFYVIYIELDRRIVRGFNRTVATGVASQQGALTLPDTWFRLPKTDPL